MNYKKLLIASLSTTVLGAIIGIVCCGGIFNWVYKIDPTNIWRTMENIPWVKFYIFSFLVEIILVYTYTIINKAIPGNTIIKKGAAFGLIVWAIGTLPGMVSTDAFMRISSAVVIYWTILGLFTYILKGIVISAIYKN